MTEPFVHWLIYNLPRDTRELPQGIPATPHVDGKPKADQGKNSFGSIGYQGPKPPKGHGVHHYHFHVFALDSDAPLQPNLEKPALLAAIKPHIVAEGDLIGTYRRD